MAAETVLSLEEALAPYRARFEERRRARGLVLERRLAELITADDPAPGVAAFGRRMVRAWVAEIEVGLPSTAVAFWNGPVQLAVVEHDRALGGGQ